MGRSQLSLFIEKMNSDEKLRQQVWEAEKQVADRTAKVKHDIDAVSQQNLRSLRRIALEHGFDIEVDENSPLETRTTPSEQEIEGIICVLTCCWVATSVWDGEGIPTVDGPGCGPGTTSHCPF